MDELDPAAHRRAVRPLRLLVVAGALSLIALLTAVGGHRILADPSVAWYFAPWVSVPLWIAALWGWSARSGLWPGDPDRTRAACVGGLALGIFGGLAGILCYQAWPAAELPAPPFEHLTGLVGVVVGSLTGLYHPELRAWLVGASRPKA